MLPPVQRDRDPDLGEYAVLNRSPCGGFTRTFSMWNRIRRCLGGSCGASWNALKTRVRRSRSWARCPVAVAWPNGTWLTLPDAAVGARSARGVVSHRPLTRGRTPGRRVLRLPRPCAGQRARTSCLYLPMRASRWFRRELQPPGSFEVGTPGVRLPCISASCKIDRFTLRRRATLGKSPLGYPFQLRETSHPIDAIQIQLGQEALLLDATRLMQFHRYSR